MKKRVFQTFWLLVFILIVFIGALFFADWITSNSAAQDLVEQFGYLGILVIAFITGLNLIIPVPAAAFVPIFTAAGYSLPEIIITVVIGTTIADSVGYLIGMYGRRHVLQKYPRLIATLHTIKEKHRQWMLPFVFVYAALSPIPNEALMIPLALMGFKYRVLIIPFILGTIVNQTILAYGAQNIFEVFFG